MGYALMSHTKNPIPESEIPISVKALFLTSITILIFIFIMGPVAINIIMHPTDAGITKTQWAGLGIILSLSYIWLMYFKHRFSTLEMMKARCHFSNLVYIVIFVATPLLIWLKLKYESQGMGFLEGAWALPAFAFFANQTFYPILRLWSKKLTNSPQQPAN